MLNLIVAHDLNDGIGVKNKMPWDIPQEMDLFRRMTDGQIIIMGKNTWKSLQSGPLPNRINIVISTTMKSEIPGLYVFSDMDDCIRFVKKLSKEIFVIGGAQLYTYCLDRGLVSSIVRTIVREKYDCDTYFPSHLLELFQSKEKKEPDSYIFRGFDRMDSKNLDYQVMIYGDTKGKHIDNVMKIYNQKYVNNEENQFLGVIRDIYLNGNERKDRTGVGTLSKFNVNLEFDISERFPLMTARSTPLRWIFEELMLYLRGQTDSKILEEKNIMIWKGNTTREFLDKRGLNQLPIGDMGSSYGFQLRHFGADYDNCNTDYTGKGFDQLEYVIDLLKNNPDSRRIIINMWNPAYLDTMALPPCLFMYQFYVHDGKLSCKAIQRSSDIAVAGNWNICTASLLTYMLAWQCNLKPHKVIWDVSDAHIYLNQMSAVRELLNRPTKRFPKLTFVNPPEDILNFQWENIKLTDYYPEPSIKFPFNA